MRRSNRPRELRGEIYPILTEAGPVAVAAIAAVSKQRLWRPYPLGPLGTDEARCLEVKSNEPQRGMASWSGALSILCRLLCRQILPGPCSVGSPGQASPYSGARAGPALPPATVGVARAESTTPWTLGVLRSWRLARGPQFCSSSVHVVLTWPMFTHFSVEAQ
jgi:hypothetical protein